MRTLYLFLALLLLYACSSNTPKTWEQTKMAGLAYPKDSIVCDSSKIPGENLQVTWINYGYRNYPHKDFCNHHIRLRFSMKDSSVRVIVNENPLFIQKLLLYHYRQYGVAHFTNQLLTPGELVVDLYTEEMKNQLGLMSAFTIPGKAEFNNDDTWKDFETLLK